MLVPFELRLIVMSATMGESSTFLQLSKEWDDLWENTILFFRFTVT